MRIVLLLLTISTFLFQLQSYSQGCTTLGQNPNTAFPVCGTNEFMQNTVPLCGTRFVPGPCTNDGVADRNPFWYKFTCFRTGTLGFLITPLDLGDDYDWQLWDVTGKNPNDVYTNASLFVACNWSAEYGLTGASAAGSQIAICAGFGKDKFSVMPTIIEGHNYLLLISHFTDSQSGYGLSFGGGTASITDTTTPGLKTITASCDATKIRLQLNKRMQCKSLAANGSDFSLSPAVANIVGATGDGCSSGFDLDSLTLTLDKPIPPGNYTIVAKTGSDGNTLLNYCDNPLAAGTSIGLVIAPLLPTPMDSLSRLSCAPTELQLVFKKGIRCNSIAANGSDFSVSGPSTITISSATGNCTPDGLTSIIHVTLSAPMVVGGNYTITLQNGSDGNTLVDECGQITPAGSNINFAIQDTVSANFNYTVTSGCKTDVLDFTHDGAHGVNQWQWDFGNGATAQVPQSQQSFPALGSYTVSLAVSNGFCTDTASANILLNDAVKADFQKPGALCPNDSALFVDRSQGNVTAWSWNFGNGETSTVSPPPFQLYPTDITDRNYTVSLVVFNSAGCSDTITKSLKVVSNCRIDIPSAFTPNGDGLNDYLYPLNAYKATDLLFRVYNRYGQMVFETRDWQVKWDGTVNGRKQSTGNYTWVLSFTNVDTGKKFNMKGNTVLIR